MKEHLIQIKFKMKLSTRLNIEKKNTNALRTQIILRDVKKIVCFNYIGTSNFLNSISK